MLSKIALSMIALSMSAAFGHAQETRYQLERTDDGYVRLDTTTGEMSLCKEDTGQLVCRVAADERTAVQDELDRMSASIRTLADRVAGLEKSQPSASLPSEEEFDRTMTYMQRFFRGFMDIVKDLESDGTSGGQQKT